MCAARGTASPARTTSCAASPWPPRSTPWPRSARAARGAAPGADPFRHGTAGPPQEVSAQTAPAGRSIYNTPVRPVSASPASSPGSDLGHAVVLGGSIAGLLAARVLSDHFARVTLV